MRPCSALDRYRPAGRTRTRARTSASRRRQCEAIVAVAQSQTGASRRETYLDRHPAADARRPARSARRHGLAGAVPPFRPNRTRTEEVWCIGVGRRRTRCLQPDPTIGIGMRGTSATTSRAPATATETLRDAAAYAPAGGPGDRPGPSASRVLDIPLDHLGPYEVEVGEAGLPDGALSTRSATRRRRAARDFLDREGPRSTCEPVDPARPPIGNIYREPFDGVEPSQGHPRVRRHRVQSGSVLQVRDIVVE